MNRPSSFSSRFLGIKPGEAAIAFSFFAYFFLITAPFGIIKPIRDASFLDELGSRNLPLAYGTTIIIAFVVALHSKIQARLSRSVLITGSLAFFVLTSLAFWLLFPLDWKWLPLAFWLWANIFVMVLVTQFWMAVNDVFDPRKAKRLIGFFGSGGILGGIAGSLLAGFLAGPTGAHRLLLPAAVLLAASALPVRAIFRLQRSRPGEAGSGHSTPASEEKVGFKACYDTVRRDGYLRLLAAVVLVTGIVSTFADWQSKNIIVRWPHARSNLTAFFGFFEAGLLVFSFLLQLLFTSNILERFGQRLTLLLYPVMLLLCSLGIVFWPGIILAIAVKGTDKSLSYSVNQSARELLYIPVRPDAKYKAKVFIDMFLNRLSKSFGGVFLILLILPFREPSIILVSLVAAGFIVLWIGLNLKISRQYIELLKTKLGSRWGRAEKLVAEQVDVASAKLVFDALESRKRSPVLYAQHLFELLAQNKLTPEVRAFLSSQIDEARITSLGSLLESESSGWVPELSRPDEDDVLKTDVREILSLDVYQEVMKTHIDKVLSDPKDEVSRMEVAKSLGWMESGSPLTMALEELLQDDNVEVVRYAIDSAAHLGRREDVPFLLDRLRDPALEEDARSALERYGPRISGTLADVLADPAEKPGVREQAALILAAFATQEAVDFLLWELTRGPGELTGAIIDALDRVKATKPELAFGGEVIRNGLHHEMQFYFQAYLTGHKAGAFAGTPVPGTALSRTLESGLRNIFRLLGLIFPHEDIERAYQSIQAGTTGTTAYAVELLDNVLPRDLRESLLPIVEDLPVEERVRRFRALMSADGSE